MTAFEKLIVTAAFGAAILLIGCDSREPNQDVGETKTGLEADSPAEIVDMIKLYKELDGRWHYHEAWAGDNEITEHWGVVGDNGESREHKLTAGEAESDALRRVLRGAVEDGYTEIELDDHVILVVEYDVDGFGTPEDLDKRHRLQDRMGGVLGWPGLGHCDGGSIGSDTMEIACFVVDFDIAKKVIEEDLKGTEFEDFTRIYNESGPKS
jgi:hypothetical protein